MNTDITAACLGALLGGALIWALETWVFNTGAPGVIHQVVDWAAPLVGAAILGAAAAAHRLHGPDSPPAGPGPGNVTIPPQRDGDA